MNIEMNTLKEEKKKMKRYSNRPQAPVNYLQNTYLLCQVMYKVESLVVDHDV
jgi:hypothetical protein